MREPVYGIQIIVVQFIFNWRKGLINLREVQYPPGFRIWFTAQKHFHFERVTMQVRIGVTGVDIASQLMGGFEGKFLKKFNHRYAIPIILCI